MIELDVCAAHSIAGCPDCEPPRSAAIVDEAALRVLGGFAATACLFCPGTGRETIEAIAREGLIYARWRARHKAARAERTDAVRAPCGYLKRGKSCFDRADVKTCARCRRIEDARAELLLAASGAAASLHRLIGHSREIARTGAEIAQQRTA